MLDKKTKAILFFFLLIGMAAAAMPVKIYKNGGCGHCVPYMDGLMKMLDDEGYKDIVIKDFMQEDDAKKAMYNIQNKFNVPLQLQGHMIVLIGEDYLFEGHVPTNIMLDYLKNPKGKIVVTQDNMDAPTYYQVLRNDQIYTYPIDAKIGEGNGNSGANTNDAGNLLAAELIPFGMLAIAAGLVIYSLRGKK